MKLKVICQICGETDTLDLDEPMGVNPWRFYNVNEIVEGLEKWQDYEILICPSCIPFEDIECDYDEFGQIISMSPIVDFNKLEEKIIKAMEIKKRKENE